MCKTRVLASLEAYSFCKLAIDCGRPLETHLSSGSFQTLLGSRWLRFASLPQAVLTQPLAEGGLMTTPAKCLIHVRRVAPHPALDLGRYDHDLRAITPT
jgi:hypothetical protein